MAGCGATSSLLAAAAGHAARVWLFSYGSNHAVHLAARLGVPPASVHPHAATLHHHQRRFLGYSSRWRGSVATVVRVPTETGSAVHGTAVALTHDQLAVIDELEGAGRGPASSYALTAATFEVHELAERVEGVVYVMGVRRVAVAAARPEDWRPPSADYLRSVYYTAYGGWGALGEPLPAADSPWPEQGLCVRDAAGRRRATFHPTTGLRPVAPAAPTSCPGEDGGIPLALRHGPTGRVPHLPRSIFTVPPPQGQITAATAR